jgi:hypothetical protein
LLKFPTPAWEATCLLYEYALDNNRMLVVNENWDYFVLSTIDGQIVKESSVAFEGNFGETCEGTHINSMFN